MRKHSRRKVMSKKHSRRKRVYTKHSRRKGVSKKHSRRKGVSKKHSRQRGGGLQSAALRGLAMSGRRSSSGHSQGRAGVTPDGGGGGGGGGGHGAFGDDGGTYLLPPRVSRPEALRRAEVHNLAGKKQAANSGLHGRVRQVFG
jgi:hypothetical protein